MDATATRQWMKRCSLCGTLLPIANFRLRRQASDARHSECAGCHTANERLRRDKKRRRRYCRFLAEVHQRRDRGLDRLLVIINTAINDFGGLDGFMLATKEHLEAAIRQGNHWAFVRHFRCIIELLAVAQPAAAAREEEELRWMSNEHLDDELRTHATAILRNHGLDEADAEGLAERIVGGT